VRGACAGSGSLRTEKTTSRERLTRAPFPCSLSLSPGANTVHPPGFVFPLGFLSYSLPLRRLLSNAAVSCTQLAPRPRSFFASNLTVLVLAATWHPRPAARACRLSPRLLRLSHAYRQETTIGASILHALYVELSSGTQAEQPRPPVNRRRPWPTLHEGASHVLHPFAAHFIALTASRSQVCRRRLLPPRVRRALMRSESQNGCETDLLSIGGTSKRSGCPRPRGSGHSEQDQEAQQFLRVGAHEPLASRFEEPTPPDRGHWQKDGPRTWAGRKRCRATYRSFTCDSHALPRAS
jgi:hypothetical protein